MPFQCANYIVDRPWSNLPRFPGTGCHIFHDLTIRSAFDFMAWKIQIRQMYVTLKDSGEVAEKLCPCPGAAPIRCGG
jgi:hypothetical protein